MKVESLPFTKFLLVLFLMFVPLQWGASSYLFGGTKIGIGIKIIVNYVSVIWALFYVFYRAAGKKYVLSSLESCFMASLFLIFFWDIISGCMHPHPFWVTGAGAFFHIKNFIPFFFVSSLQWDKDDEIRSVYKQLRSFAVFLAIIAVFQECLFWIGTFGFSNPFKFVFWPDPLSEIRFGFLYRAPSIVGHPNILAIFLLLFIALEAWIGKSFRILSILILGAYCSFSRMPYLVLIVIMFWAVMLRRRLIYFIFMILPLVFLLLTSRTSIQEISPTAQFEPTTQSSGASVQGMAQSRYRGYVIQKSIEIWKKNKIFGVGPGMYGDVVSFLINSPVYRKYKWDDYYFSLAKRERNLDQFYCVIMAEGGLPLLIFFGMFFTTLMAVPFLLLKRLPLSFAKDLSSGLVGVPPLLLIMLLFNTINMTFFWFSYLALLGMVVSYMKSSQRGIDDKNKTYR